MSIEQGNTDQNWEVTTKCDRCLCYTCTQKECYYNRVIFCDSCLRYGWTVITKCNQFEDWGRGYIEK